MRPRLDDELIYKAALPFFAKYGYKKTTLEDIASALDMSNTNLYSYARSKRDLYQCCVDYAIDQWQEFVRQQTRDIEDPKEKLVTTWRSAVGYIIGNEEMMALLKNDPTIFPMFPNVDPIEEYNDWSVQYVKEILEEGIEKGVFRATINVTSPPPCSLAGTSTSSSVPSKWRSWTRPSSRRPCPPSASSSSTACWSFPRKVCKSPQQIRKTASQDARRSLFVCIAFYGAFYRMYSRYRPTFGMRSRSQHSSRLRQNGTIIATRYVRNAEVVYQYMTRTQTRVIGKCVRYIAKL